MSRTPQDSFVDDEDEFCPLCVEEFDLSDRNFRPCPCGYQICQFCYNNIKTTMNGLCPACRRPYDEKNIEWKEISPEEIAKHKADIAQKAKKNAQLRQKEAQKREADSLSRKHLAGLRVVQKNLVYVTGLTPTTREDRLLDILRGPEYFGQYGKIIKIVVSKAKDTSHGQQSVGVYVTFARKEDAAACIAAVDGSQNGDRILRAQHGTTKYCSAYLRNEQCNNRNCMFLHEPGEENESFTRQDLSSMSAISTQQPANTQGSHTNSHSQSQALPHRVPQTSASTTHQMHRQESTEGTSPTDGPALPSTASWASKPAQQTRRPSRTTSIATASPVPSVSVPANAADATKSETAGSKSTSTKEVKTKESSVTAKAEPSSSPAPAPQRPSLPYLDDVFKTLRDFDFKFVFSMSSFTPEEAKIIKSFPPLFDPQGGAKRRAMKEKQRQRLELEAQAALHAASASEMEENPEGGSLQLGGEPEERQDPGSGLGRQHAIAPPSQQNAPGAGLGLGPTMSIADEIPNMRGLAPHHQQILLQQFKSGTNQAANLLNAFQGNQPQTQLTLNHAQQPGAQAHTRQTSRFSFANESNASAAVQPVANAKLMSQQSSMMPKAATGFNQIPHQALSGQFYTSSVQGPPPGLKAAGTPPISGGGMFGQGHGFATGGLGYGANMTSRNPNEDMMRELLRGRGSNNGSLVLEAGKRESMFPSFLQQYPQTSTPAPAPGLLNFPYGPQPGAYQDSGSQKQKKKGKKHRHANTSSSGGGGVVDVADPSILQARLHQGGSMVGQGLYTGQGQDEQEFSVSGQASWSVGNLMDDIDSAAGIHPGGHLHEPRRATPTIPPGLTAPKNAVRLGENTSRPQSRIALVSPAVPIIPATPTRTFMPAEKVNDALGKAESSTADMGSERTQSKSDAQILRDITDTTQQNPKSTDFRDLHKGSPPIAMVKDRGSPLKNSAFTEAPAPMEEKNATVPNAKGTDVKLPSPAPIATVVAAKSPAPIQSKTAIDSMKRQAPAKLDITAATLSTVSLEQVAKGSNEKGQSVSGSPVVPQPAAPASISTGSPVKRTAPRTLRVVPTPKTEVPPPVNSASASAVQPVAEKLRSRQASIASINVPGTPASELISDNASVTSASLSRASSPPPGGRVGSAPVRKKTKSQARKERQERAKHLEELELIEAAKPASDEPVQAPIISRKKKTKKPANVSAVSATPTPNASAPASPKPKKVEVMEEKEVEAKKEVADAAATAGEKETQAGTQESPTEKIVPSAGSILAELQKRGELEPSKLEFFKPLSAGSHRSVETINAPDLANSDRKIHFSDEDLVKIVKHETVRLGGEDGRNSSRTLITPEHNMLRGMSKETEDRFLALERMIKEIKGPAKYRHQSSVGRNEHPSHSALMQNMIPTIANTLLSIGKKQPAGSQKGDPASDNGQKQTARELDDALRYINQWVLPAEQPLASQNRTETASVGNHMLPNRLAASNLSPEVAAALPDPDKGDSYLTAEMLEDYFVLGLESVVGGGIPGSGTSAAPAAAGVLSVEEAEEAWVRTKKEAEKLEKQVNALIKRNRKVLSGVVGGHSS